MKTNAKISLRNLKSGTDREFLLAIIESFPIEIEVSPPGSEITAETYDDGRMTSLDKFFHINLTSESFSVSCRRLNELDAKRYEVSFSSNYGVFPTTKCVIKDNKQRYALEIHSCRGLGRR